MMFVGAMEAVSATQSRLAVVEGLLSWRDSLPPGRIVPSTCLQSPRPKEQFAAAGTAPLASYSLWGVRASYAAIQLARSLSMSKIACE
jgi:hypothetical protein